MILLFTKSMKTSHNYPTNFWFGFALGTVSAITLSYLLGTKQGRELLKKLVKVSEHLDETSPDFLGALTEISQVFRGEKQQLNPQIEKQTNSSLTNVLDKIRHATQPPTYIKKFFSKSGRLISE